MRNYMKIIAALGGFLILVVGLELAAGYGLYLALQKEHQQNFLALLFIELELLIELKFLALAILSIIFIIIWQRYITGTQKVVEGIRIILNAHPSHRLELTSSNEIKALALAVNDLAEYSETLTRNLEAKVAQAKTSVEEEKNRLAALMSELSQGVVVCNRKGRILLCNERARLALSTPGNPQTSSLVGLGRSISTIIDHSQLSHALENLQMRLQRDEVNPTTQFVMATRSGQFVRVQIAPVLAQHSDNAQEQNTTLSGFVMIIENITRTFETESTRDMLLQSLTDGSRSMLANIRAAIETLLYYPDCEIVTRDRFLQVIYEETCNLSKRLAETVAEHADSLKTRWPLEEMRGVDLITAAQRRIENRINIHTSLETPDERLWIKADSYMLTQAISYVATRLHQAFQVDHLYFHIQQHAQIAQLDMIWNAPRLSQNAVRGWETDPMSSGGEDSLLSFRDVIEHHGAETVYMVDKGRQKPLFRWLLPIARPMRDAQESSAYFEKIRFESTRPEFYDFDLFNQTDSTAEWNNCLLSECSYTVFDTETTGLNPTAGDEIIALGAVRIVNNRLLRYDTYEQLIDPQRPIEPTAQAIHGISHEMLRGQPTIDLALPPFYEYCADSVLVAHNAFFDMRFLQLKEEQTGIRFTQPVLDTLLLSEVLHPHQESHSLEAICERLGVKILARHTALGDSLVTAEVFLRMIPLLTAQGIRTVGDVRIAMEKIYQKVKY